MWRKLPTYFLRGALVTAPLALTVFIIVSILQWIDQILPIPVPGLGLLITLIGITLIGFLTSNVIGRGALEVIDRFLKQLPFVKLVYTSIKDLIAAFVGERKSFDRAVAIRTAPDSPIQLLGFVTRADLAVLGKPRHVAVYLPQSYNFAGNLVVVPAELVEPIHVPSGELMTFIVSGGVSGFGIGQSVLPPPSSPQASPQAPPPVA